MIVLVEGNLLNDKVLTALLRIFTEAVKNTVDKEKKEKLQKGATLIKKLKESEETQRKLDEKDINELDTLLKDI